MAFKIPAEENPPTQVTSKAQISAWAAEKEKLMNMRGGADMDCLIAENVFGFVRLPGDSKNSKVACYRDPSNSDPTRGYFFAKDYSTNISSAMEAAEKAKLFDGNVSLGKDFVNRWVVVERGQSEEMLMGSGDTPALAISRAILIVLFDEAHPVITPRVTEIQPIAKSAFQGAAISKSLHKKK